MVKIADADDSWECTVFWIHLNQYIYVPFIRRVRGDQDVGLFDVAIATVSSKAIPPWPLSMIGSVVPTRQASREQIDRDFGIDPNVP